MRQHDGTRAAIVQQSKRGKRSADPGVISDLTISIEWNIEIHSHQRALPFYLILMEITKSSFLHGLL